MTSLSSPHVLAWLRSTLLRRVMAWAFLASVGIALGSPLIKPQGIELLCSGSGAMKLLVKSSDVEPISSAQASHCTLCAIGDALPPALGLPSLSPAPSQIALFSPYFAPLARTLPPLPARGPP